MAERRLSPDEVALWRRVMASVRPISGQKLTPPDQPPVSVAPQRVAIAPQLPKSVPGRAPGITLDAGWDKRLARGLVSPDHTVDLHGHGLHSAYHVLDQELGRAISGGARLVLLITGKPPRPESERPHARGAIRAAVGDWLAASRHSGRIAAVRSAHVRHGGAGALYIVLRRQRVS